MRRQPIVEDRSAEPACVTLGHQWRPRIRHASVHVPKGSFRPPNSAIREPIGAPRACIDMNAVIECEHCATILSGVTLLVRGLVLDPANPRTLIMEDR